MANEAYEVLQDTSLPRAIREIDELVDGKKIYETVGQNYPAGSVVLADEISPDIRESIESTDDYDHVLRPISRKDALEFRDQQQYGDQYGTFVPEHEAEAEILDRYGHETVPRAHTLELNAAGADEAKKALEEAKKDDADARPNLTAPPTPDLAASSAEGKAVVADPKDEDKARGRRSNVAKRQARPESAQTTPSGVVGGQTKKDAEKAGASK